MMELNRLIRVTLTGLTGLLGAALGWTVGSRYGHPPQTMPELVSPTMLVPPQAVEPAGISLLSALAGAVLLGVLFAAIGYFTSNRVLLNLNRLQQMAAPERALGISGALAGLLCGALFAYTLPSTPHPHIWLIAKWSLMLLCSVLGVALLRAMRPEMLRLLPQLERSIAQPEAVLSQTPKLLDTNVIIDGRMADLCKTGFIEGPLYVPNFVLDEVQYIADSPDSLRRSRGRRGLEILNTMHEFKVVRQHQGQTQEIPLVHVLNEIPPSVQKIDTVDNKLVFLAKELSASIVTNDYNLNRVAELQGVAVLNINELAQSLKPVVLPGEEMNLQLIKEGKESGQGVGYLPDGTMVVVSDGAAHLGETCKVVISTVYQTVAGKMIFADIKGPKGAGDDLFDEPCSASRKKR